MRVKSVAFNELDPDQAKLLAHAEKRSNFSAYVKRLIQRDMEGGRPELVQKEPAKFDKSLMQGLI